MNQNNTVIPSNVTLVAVFFIAFYKRYQWSKAVAAVSADTRQTVGDVRLAQRTGANHEHS